LGEPDVAGLVPIGRIGRPHGVHGEMRLIPYNAGSALFVRGRAIHVGGVVHRLSAVRAVGDTYVVAIEGVVTREGAAALTNAEVAVPRAELPPPSADELYLVDLVGCACFAGEVALGTVARVATYPASICLVVEGEAGVREIPAVAPYLAGVDLAARRIEIAHADDFPVERPRAKKAP
jgi:16S rRNA processing protein RimM